MSSNITLSVEDQEFEMMLKEAMKIYTETPPFLLRVALKASLKEEELHKAKKLNKKVHLIDTGKEVEEKYMRKAPEKMEYDGIVLTPPTEVEIVEEASTSAQ